MCYFAQANWLALHPKSEHSRLRAERRRSFQEGGLFVVPSFRALTVDAFRGKNILEHILKPRFFMEFENHGLFSAPTQQGRKGEIFKLRKKTLL